MVSEESASLTIKQVGKRDCVKYSCRLRDSVSDATVEFKLSLPRGPTQVSWKTKDTLALQWEVPESDGGAMIEEYFVERREIDMGVGRTL